MIFEGVDLFCGAGGTTTGIERAKSKGRRIAYVIAAVNHDPLAIESHSANHRRVKHFVEDIRTLDVTQLPKIHSSNDKKTFLWASAECTNFSNAKGGGPRDADSRTLPIHLYRYIEYLMPDYIFIENVREFLSWGPLEHKKDKKTGLYCFDKKGNPVMVPESRTKGKDFINWKNHIQSYGYECDYRILDAADFGANTSRKRLFIIFAKTGLPIAWPKPTHSKGGKNGLKKWNAVKECLDFTDKGKNIFNRKKPLSERTYKRIYEGLVKFVAHGDTAFLTKWLSNNPVTGTNPGKSINDPCPVITTQNRLGIINIQPAANSFIYKAFSSNNNTNVNKGQSIDFPSPAITTQNRIGLVSIDFLNKYHSNGKNILSIEEPCSTLTTKDRIAKVTVDKFTMTYYGGDGHVHSIEDPANAITTKDHHALIQTEYFMDEQYGNGKCKSLEDPSGCLMTNPKQKLVAVEKGWLMDTNYGNTGSSINEPAPTLLASRRHFYLMNPQYSCPGSSIEDPCFTLIARMDKKPPYLIEVLPGRYAIKIEENDSPYMIKIKQFMACYNIFAVLMRMLKVPELLRIQGFGEKYILAGNQSDQKKFIGNAVPPNLPQKMFEALNEANSNESLFRLAI